MRKFTLLLCGALMAAGIVAARPQPAHAELKPPVIAVLDHQRVLQEAVAMKGIQKQLDSQAEVYKKEIDAQEDKLRSAEQELAKQRSILSQDAFNQKRRDFEKQVTELQKSAAIRKRNLDQAFNEARNKVVQTMLQITEEVAREQGANMVLAQQMVLVADKSLDITDVVVDRVNKKLPQVAVSLPKK